MESKKSVLIFPFTLYDGGAERVASILARELSEKYSVSVAYYIESQERYDFGDRCVLYSLPYRDTSNPSLVYRLRCLKKRIRALKRLREEKKFDIVLSLCFVPCFINAMSRGQGLTLCAERTSPKKNGFFLWLLTRWAYRRADGVIFQSETVRGMFDKDIREKSCILKNPVLIPAPADGVRRKRVVNIGRLVKQKNQTLLTRSFAAFHRDHPEYTLSIYGEGEEREHLRKLIDTLGAEDWIFLEGNRPDVHDQIRDAEMFVLSSDYEGLSNALLECMSMGIACISTKCEGSTDVIRPMENGVLVDIRDEAGLTSAMTMLAEDPALRHKLEKQAMTDLRSYEKSAVAEEWDHALLAFWKKKYGEQS